MSDGDVLFFGCVDRAGHHLYIGPSLAWARSHPIEGRAALARAPRSAQRGAVSTFDFMLSALSTSAVLWLWGHFALAFATRD